MKSHKVIIFLMTGGFLFNLVYMVAMLKSTFIAYNPWYLYAGGILMIITALAIRSRNQRN